MRHAVLSTFLFVAILGLGCMGVAVPVKADELKQKPWPGYKTKLTVSSSNWELRVRYSASGDKYFAMLEAPMGHQGRCEGAVDQQGNLQPADCTPDGDMYMPREIAGKVYRINLLNPQGGGDGGAVFVDDKLANQIKSERAGKKR